MRTLALVLISVALMIANHQVDAFARFRSNLSMVVLPMQAMVDRPIRFFSWLGTSIVTQQEVLGENAQLRARQLLLEAKLQRLLALEHENEQLRGLLSSSSHLEGKTLVAQLLAVEGDPLNQRVILNKGANDGLFVGQPVLDAYGVMGQVVEVTPFTSQVMLISDSRSALPVQDNRNGMRFVVAGTGYAGQLNLLNVSGTTDIAVGDTLVTSGLGGKFPFGYPVGEVVSIQQKTEERFAVVMVKPSAQLNKSRQVILIWPSLEESLLTLHKAAASAVEKKAKKPIK